MTVETSAMWRIERALGLHAWRRVLAWWALARAQRAWKLRSSQVWFGDRRAALGAARRSAVTQYGRTLNHRVEKRQRQSPQGRAARELRETKALEADARERVLDLHERFRDVMWARGRRSRGSALFSGGVVLAVAGVGVFAALLIGGVTDRGAAMVALAVGSLFIPLLVGAVVASVGRSTVRAAGRAEILWGNRDKAMTDYDLRWFALCDAERTSGAPGAALVVAPHLWHRRGKAHATLGDRPSRQLLAVPFPALIDREAQLLAQGDPRTVRAYADRFGRGRPFAALTTLGWLTDDGTAHEQAGALRTTGSDAATLAADMERMRADMERMRADHRRGRGSAGGDARTGPGDESVGTPPEDRRTGRADAGS